MRLNRKRRGLDPMIAMINVIFILLGFFMLGQFREATPQAIEVPQAQGERYQNHSRIIVNQEGDLTWQNQNDRSESGLPAGVERSVIVLADARLKANRLLTIITDLEAEGYQVVGLEVQE